MMEQNHAWRTRWLSVVLDDMGVEIDFWKPQKPAGPDVAMETQKEILDQIVNYSRNPSGLASDPLSLKNILCGSAATLWA
jgi:hypothetical protein